MSGADAHTPTELRQLRGLAIAEVCRIDKKPGCYLVPSQNRAHRYTVTLGASPWCSCPDFGARGQKCKHIYAVEYSLKRETTVVVENDGASQTVTETTTVTATKRVTYKQDWPAYNAAQTHEKDRFQELLADLCSPLADPPINPKGGRPAVPLAARVFSSVFKVYSTLSCRRFSCDLKDAYDKGHIARLPHYNSVLRYLEDPEMTPVLKRLVIESSLPLASVETRFAVDSSGFMTSRFERWFDQKYGGFKSQYDWVKVHVITGVKTNIVTNVEVGGPHAHDTTMFIPLVEKTAEHFAIGEVSADSAYCNGANFETVATLGGTPYIDFRRNTTAAAGGTFGKMFHLFNLNREEYAKHYHARSNVESTFSMIKAKFGDSLRSKSDAAMVNESLCKILCHNLCVLIQSAYELGVTARFWAEGVARQVVAPADDGPDMNALAWM